MRHLFATLVLLAALSLGAHTTLYEDGSVQFFNRPGLGFCLPAQLCDEGN